MFLLIQALLYIMYKLVEDGPSREVDEMGQFVSITTCRVVSGCEYPIQFIYEYIFLHFFRLACSIFFFFFLKRNVTRGNLRNCVCQED